jgi:DNA-binding MurR/RpiR family transcriptional regulator
MRCGRITLPAPVPPSGCSADWSGTPTTRCCAPSSTTRWRPCAPCTVYLYGQGNATILVDQLSRRLQRFGINPVALVGSKRDIAERVAGIGPADLLVAFAFRRLPSTLCPLIDLAGIRGAHSVLITDTLLSMSPAPSRIVAAPRGGTDDFLSLTVPMAIANAVVLTMARTSPDTTIRTLDSLAATLDHFDV